MDEKERRRIRMKRVAEEFVKNVGKVIRQHRIDSGLSQDDLADGIVMGRSIIGKYERGEGEISASAMAKISVYLKFPLREYTYDVINKELGDKPEDILKYLIKINEAKRTDEIEKELRKPLADYAPVTESFQDMIIEPRQMIIEAYLDYMSDGNLAYKYGEYPWKEWREEPKE